MEWLGLVVFGVACLLVMLGFFMEDRILRPKKTRKVKVSVVDDKMAYTIEGCSPEETVRIRQKLEECKGEL